jgi:methyl-accepting chemotaxis protein
MLLAICTTGLVTFAVTIALVSWRASDMARSQATRTAEATAGRYASMVRNELEAALDAAATLAQAQSGQLAADQPLSRATSDAQLRAVLSGHEEFYGVWTGFEPGAFDGRDADFAGGEGHDTTGRYIPYYYRSGGGIARDVLVGYDQPGDGDYYLRTRDSGREAVLDPFAYEVDGRTVLMTSLTAPVRRDGRVVGVTGVDVTLDMLHDLVADIRIGESGMLTILSADLGVVAHPDAGRAGQPFREFAPWIERHQGDLSSGRSFVTWAEDAGSDERQLHVVSPVTLGASDQIWYVVASLPEGEVLAEAHRIATMAVVVGVIGVALLMAVVFLIARSIAGPVGRIAGELGVGADQVRSASGQVATSSQHMAEGAGEQAAALEEVASSLTQMTSQTQRNAGGAREASELMIGVRQQVQQSDAEMTAMSTAIDEIKDAATETARILKTIDEIAFQTNLLALNAAVEAARAGDAGKGFAVVAEEVRNLAQRAGEAARNTAGLVERSQESSDRGVTSTGRVVTAFQSIAEQVERATQVVQDIARASGEQAEGIDQINTAVGQVDETTQGTAASAEESAAAAEELNAQADELHRVVRALESIVRGDGGTSRPASPVAAAPVAPVRSADRGPAPAPAARTTRPADTVTELDESDDLLNV